MRIRYCFILAVILSISSCDHFNGDVGPTSVSTTYTISQDEAWNGYFSDYPLYQENKMDLQSGFRPLPAPLALDTTHSVFYLAGTNHSDNLFMFTKRKMGNLHEGAKYRLTFEVTIATNAPSGCAGIGGAPGENVYVKAGAIGFEPVPQRITIADTTVYRMNIDKGIQSRAGTNAVVLGNIANSRNCDQERQYEFKSLKSTESVTAETNANGEIWIFVGTDSAFEGRTSIYYLRFTVEATRIN